MCGLCGFGLDDAQALLQLDQSQSSHASAEMTGSAGGVYEQSAPHAAPQFYDVGKAEGVLAKPGLTKTKQANISDADKRSLYTLVASALGIVRIKRLGAHRAAVRL
jgi:hypothetical protein